jgi:hypothetical protein
MSHVNSVFPCFTEIQNVHLSHNPFLTNADLICDVGTVSVTPVRSASEIDDTKVELIPFPGEMRCESLTPDGSALQI